MKNPALVTDPLYEFLGYEDEVFSTTPTSSGFVADIEKRDAVVAAFRVRAASRSKRVTSIHLRRCALQ